MKNNYQESNELLTTNTMNTDLLMTKCQLPTNHKHYNLFKEIMIYVEMYVEGCTEDEAYTLEHVDIIFLNKRPNFARLICIIFKSVQMSYEAYNYVSKISYAENLYEHLNEYMDELYAITRTGTLRHKHIYTILAIEEQLEDKVTPNIRQIVENRDLNRYLVGFV
jgi:hypothetical protein